MAVIGPLPGTVTQQAVADKVREIIQGLSHSLTAVDNFAPEGTEDDVLTSKGSLVPAYESPTAQAINIIVGSGQVSLVGHTHDAMDIVSGRLSTGVLPTGVVFVDQANPGTLAWGGGASIASSDGFPDVTGPETVSGAWDFSARTLFSNTDDVDLVGISGAIIIGGDGTGTHLALDGNEIQAKLNATTIGTLSIQADGGTLSVGGNTAATVNFNSGDFLFDATGLAWGGGATITTSDDFPNLATAETVTGVWSFTTTPLIGVINEVIGGDGVTIDGVLLKDSEVTTDVINEKTLFAGVIIDGLALKDGLARGVPGTINGPTFSFAVGPDTGMYRGLSPGFELNFARAGVLKLSIKSDNLTVTDPIQAPNGSLLLPAFSFASATDAGMYLIGTSLAFGVGNVQILGMTAAVISIFNGVNITMSAGSQFLGDGGAGMGAPAYCFDTDVDTGIYQVAANELGITTGAVLRFSMNTTLITATLPINTTGQYEVDGTQVVSNQGAAVADASGGATVDAEARTAVNDLLARLRTHGLIGT